MFNVIGKTRASSSWLSLARVLTILLMPLALTGFVCTYKIQAEDECLASTIHCYECDSRYDPNCADPFELASLSLAEQNTLAAQANNLSSPTAGASLVPTNLQPTPSVQLNFHGPSSQAPASNATLLAKVKKMPHVAVCHGCCVKITSKTPDGAIYVKRTCTSNLQINYFMVGLICMKESGDRGKMCFCETDYCNGQQQTSRPTLGLILGLTILALLTTTRNGGKQLATR